MTNRKRGFPAPFDGDFTGIVTRVARKRESAFSDLVNSPMVASYLKAGSILIERALGAREPALVRPDAQTAPYWSGLRFLTQRAVIEEVERLEPPFERRKGDGPFRSTWETHDDFISDLLTFFFHPINYDHQYGAELETRESWIIDDESFADAIDRTSHHEVAAMCRMPLFRLQIMMASTADRNDGIRAAIADNYRGALDPWVKIYEDTFAARGLRVREGVTIREVADMIAAVVEGFALRYLGDPTAEIIGDTPAGNIVGKAILGLLNSYLVPIGRAGEGPLRVEFDQWTKQIRPKN